MYYYDESRFSLVSNVPRAWQAPGKPIALEATRGPGLHVAGFLRPDGTDFHAYSTTESLKSVDISLFFNNFCLPTYSPHPNKIETLWRKIKYEWLRPEAYATFKTLQTAVWHIPDRVGQQYTIQFNT